MAWSAFVFGICLSPCDNVAAVPELSVFAIAVAAYPPLALLVAVELLNRAFNRHCVETESATAETGRTNDQRTPLVHLTTVPNESRPPADPTAMQRMWAY